MVAFEPNNYYNIAGVYDVTDFIANHPGGIGQFKYIIRKYSLTLSSQKK